MNTFCPTCGRLFDTSAYEFILPVVSEVARRNGKAFPKFVAPLAGYSEDHTREIMARLAQAGKLKRIGKRGGYLPAA